MEKWCIKAENKNQAFIIGKWFDENWSYDKNSFYQDNKLTDYYHVCGRKPGDVYYTSPQGRELTFIEFENEILNKNVEPVYDIY